VRVAATAVAAKEQALAAKVDASMADMLAQLQVLTAQVQDFLSTTIRDVAVRILETVAESGMVSRRCPASRLSRQISAGSAAAERRAAF
jgi:hypothetical protein